MKKVTSFTHLRTGEGDRIAYTFSEISPDGAIISQNNKGNFVIVDDAIEAHVTAINRYISENYLKED